MMVRLLVLRAGLLAVALGSTPCNCDCCSTVDRPLAEQTPDLKVKCAAPAPDLFTDQCGESCFPSSADTTLTAAKQNMDYSRYCQYKCKPSTVTIGTMCIRLDAEEASLTFSLDGNGNSDARDNGLPVMGPLSTQAIKWEADRTEAAAAAAKEAEELEATSSLKADITYDVSEVMKNRIESEAASAVARASAAEARAKADVAAAKRAATAARLAEGVSSFASAGEAASVEAAAVAQQAERDAQTADANLQEIVRYAQTVTDLAKKDAITEIKKQAAKPMQELAETHAKMWGWDKPKFWPKVEAVRAGAPYQAQMTIANQRFAEYEGYSKDDIAGAEGDQAKAMGLQTQANAMEAHGDKLQAENIRHEIDGLIASAKAKQAKAQSDWNMANTMRLSLPEWQGAAMKASVYAAWKYSNVFTPPPGMFLQRHAGVSPTATP